MRRVRAEYLRWLLTGAAALCCGAVLFQAGGCGYIVGGPFRQDVHTIHVPLFQNTTERRGMEFLLTEAVQKEIQKQTHFRLVKGNQADTRLTGRIVRVGKRVLGETAFDDPRELQFQMAIEVTWEDLRSGQIIRQERMNIEPESVRLLTHTPFAPELGQSLATAQQRAVENLARQIVQMMHTPW